MDFRASDVISFIEDYASHNDFVYAIKARGNGGAFITLGNHSAGLDNRTSKVKQGDVENFLKTLFGKKKAWPAAVQAFFEQGSYKFKSDFQTADLARFIEDYAAYKGLNHSIQPHNKAGSVITLGEASAELNSRKLKINHTDVEGFLTLLFGKKKKWPAEVEAFFTEGSYKFKGQKPATPAQVVVASPIADVTATAAVTAKPAFPQRAPLQPPINTSAPSGFAAAMTRWDAEHPYQYVPIASEAVASAIHISTINDDAAPYVHRLIQSRRSYIATSDIIAFIQDYASRHDANFAIAPHDKGGVALTLGIHTARIDNQNEVLSAGNVKEILKIFFGITSTWQDEVATFFEQGFYIARVSEAVAAEEAETPPSKTELAQEPAAEPAAEPIQTSAPSDRTKSFAQDTNGLFFNPLSVIDFIQKYATHYGQDYTSQPHSKSGVLVKLGTRSARVYDKKSKISQSDLEQILFELFGKKRVWPPEVQDFFEQGSYTFNAATPNEPANTGIVARSTSETATATPIVDNDATKAVASAKPFHFKLRPWQGLPILSGPSGSAFPLGESLPATTADLLSSSSILTRRGDVNVKDLIASIPDADKTTAAKTPPKPAIQQPPKPPEPASTTDAPVVIDTPAVAPSLEVIPVIIDAAAIEQTGASPIATTVVLPPSDETAVQVVIDEPIAPVLLQRPDIQISPATFITAPPNRSQHVMHHLLHHGLVKADDTVRTAAEKVAALMNSHPSVKSKNGAFDISADEVFKYLDRPQYAFSNAAWTTPLTAYRIWQAASYFNTNLERSPPALSAFWSASDNPQVPPKDTVYAIAREVYVQNVLPVLDRDANRHFQTFDQLNEAAGYTEAGFRGLMSYPWTAWRSEGGLPKNCTLVEVQRATNIVPSDYLAALEIILKCRGEQIFPHDAWHRILGDEPGKMLERGAPLSGKKFSQDDLTDASLAVLKRINDAGFNDLTDVVDHLNRRLEAVQGLPEGKDFTISIESIGRAVSRRVPFPKGFAELVYVRITEAVNERRMERGELEPLSTEQLFGVKRAAKRTLRHDAEDILVAVLQQPQNKHLLNMHRAAWVYGGKLEDIAAFYDQLDKAYTPNPDTAPEPNDDLKKLASALGVEPTALVPLAIWERAQIQNARAEATQFITSDGEVVTSEIEPPTKFLARAAAAELQAKETLRLQQLRVQLIGILRDRVDEMLTRPDAPVLDAPVLDAPAEAVVQAAAAITITIVDAPAERVPVQPVAVIAATAPVEPSAPTIVAAIEPDAPIQVMPLAADTNTDTRPVEGDFRNAALEVVTAFRQLQTANMLIELSLLDRVEGVNRRRKREDLITVAQALSLELTEAREILEETKADMAKAGSQNLGHDLAAHQVIGALQEYQSDIAGRSVLNSYLDLGRDESKDADTGNNYKPPQSAAQIKTIRERLITSMVGALQQQAPTGAS